MRQSSFYNFGDIIQSTCLLPIPIDFLRIVLNNPHSSSEIKSLSASHPQAQIVKIMKGPRFCIIYKLIGQPAIVSWMLTEAT